MDRRPFARSEGRRDSLSTLIRVAAQFLAGSIICFAGVAAPVEQDAYLWQTDEHAIITGQPPAWQPLTFIGTPQAVPPVTAAPRRQPLHRPVTRTVRLGNVAIEQRLSPTDCGYESDNRLVVCLTTPTGTLLPPDVDRARAFAQLPCDATVATEHAEGVIRRALEGTPAASPQLGVDRLRRPSCGSLCERKIILETLGK